jgi:hypothetical protein
MADWAGGCRARIRWLAFAIAATSAAGAWAQSPPGDAADKAAAEALFEEAVALRNAGEWERACAKFEASQKLDPARGTLLNLAECMERDGKLASSWAVYRQLADEAAAARDTERARIARAKIEELEPRLPRLLVEVEELAAGLEVARDGEPIEPALFGVAVPLDPGTYRLSATAPGRSQWAELVDLSERERVVVRIPRLPAGAPVPPREPGAGEKEQPRRSPRRLAAQGAGGVGVAGLGVAAAFGLRARSKWRAANDGHCTDNVCDETGLRLASEARTAARTANVAFAVGAAASVTGAILWLTARPRDRAPPASALQIAPRVGPTEIGIAIVGQWP